MANGTKLPGRTPGPLGHNDAHDPSAAAPPGLYSMEGELRAKPPSRRPRHEPPPVVMNNAPSTIELSYVAMPDDMLGSTNKDATPIAGSTNLARDGTSWLVHGNNKIEVRFDGVESTKKGWSAAAIYRVWRVWVAPLGKDGRTRTGDYVKGTDQPTQHFINDGTFGQLWNDVPGITVSPHRAERENRRHLVEFLVGVAGRPDAGGLYFMIVIDETPDEYKVTMHEHRSYTAAEWAEWFPTGYDLTEVKTNVGGETSSETRAVVAAPLGRPIATEDDLPEVLNYGGWHKFPAEHHAHTPQSQKK